MDGGPGSPYDEAMAGAKFDLVTHDDAQPTLPAAHLEGRITLPYGALAELAGESEQVLRRDGKALAPCAGNAVKFTRTRHS